MLYLNSYDLYKNRRIFDDLVISESYPIDLATIRVIEPEKYQDRQPASELHLLITDEKLSKNQLTELKNLLEKYFFDVGGESKTIKIALYSKDDFPEQEDTQLSVFWPSLKKITYETLLKETTPIKEVFEAGKKDKELIRELQQMMQNMLEEISRNTLSGKPNFYQLAEGKISKEHAKILYKIANHYHYLTMEHLTLTSKLYDRFTGDEKKIIGISCSYCLHAAAANGQLERVKESIEINTQQDKNNEENLKNLLNQTDKYKQTALEKAIFCRHEPVIRFFLEKIIEAKLDIAQFLQQQDYKGRSHYDIAKLVDYEEKLEEIIIDVKKNNEKKEDKNENEELSEQFGNILSPTQPKNNNDEKQKSTLNNLLN